jgi:hypothetical protein
MNFAKRLLSSLILLTIIGCTTAPKLVKNKQASFDEGGQNSGVLGVNNDSVLVVTYNLRDRYNSLIDYYGKKFAPPVELNDGLTPTGTNTFLMTPQAFEHFTTMLRWRKQGAPPTWAKP